MKGKCFSACNRGQRKKSDFYQTPYSMTQQLLENESFNGSIFEPASGDGAIVKILKKNNYNVAENEIRKNGIDFRKIILYNDFSSQNIITNPPFSLAFEFINISKKIYKKKIAMLLPLSYLHGQKRFDNKIFKELKTVYVFTRYPLLTNSIREDGKYETGMIAYAWYIWVKNFKNDPIIKWIDNNKFVLKKSDL